MLLSAAKLVRWVHKVVVAASATTVPSDFGRTRVGYQKMLRELCQLATSEGITLKAIETKAANHPYFKLNKDADKVAKAVWEGRKDYISHLEDKDKGKDSKKSAKSTTDSNSTGGSAKKDTSKDE